MTAVPNEPRAPRRAVPLRSPGRLSRGLAALAFLILAAGCATRPPASDPDAVADYEAANDPMEPTNRVIYKINDAVDKAVVEPVARAYAAVVPSPIRTGLHNVLDNMAAPVRLANDLLEAKPMQAGDTLLRFVVNTIFGLGGLIDVGKELKIPRHDADFGMTLGYWGVGEGPFLFLPVLGPSNPRDAAGFGVDIAMDPFPRFNFGSRTETIFSASRSAMYGLDKRTGALDVVDNVRKTALDPYATYRSLYRQNRASKIDKLRAPDRLEDHVWLPHSQPAPAGQ